MFVLKPDTLRRIDFTSIPFEKHLLVNFLLRLALIVFSMIQDKTAEVPYTDIDYRVVTDGARHALNGESPFDRHTYRYSPLLAFLMIPNLIVHESFGKVLFSLCDIMSSVLIRSIVFNELKQGYIPKSKQHSKKGDATSRTPDKYRKWSEIAAYIMLYNPMGIIISSRGSNDAVSNFLILLTFYYIQKANDNLKYSFCAGIFHGLAIHFRIFPIIFSLAYYLTLSGSNQSIWKALLLPNKKQICLAFTTVVTLSTVTFFFYRFYGLQYIQEAYLYHFSRIDIRHNFSLYFLMQYLSSDIKQTFLEKLLTLLPRVVILFYLSVTFGRKRSSLAFCIFAQTFVFVTFNTVVTSQYFVWYLALLPLCYPNFCHVGLSFLIRNACPWLFAQAFWLLSAYLLEFKCWNTFNLIGIQSVVFFLANIFVLARLIHSFNDSLNLK
ncbi:unnamed protein product [Hermetia illucens]|uniref:GPI alpha-1,4-mannosyltransferase I, catalytic subunit n=1 Tax=Hermetia illucens TaxID=343691 RepID=A0A7R8YXH1_HERIL|nr:GPI mannosyltransferase 1 [Hermetia illucens]CAD7088983.1 unnamed protein product [Hermetia illucens]